MVINAAEVWQDLHQNKPNEFNRIIWKSWQNTPRKVNISTGARLRCLKERMGSKDVKTENVV